MLLKRCSFILLALSLYTADVLGRTSNHARILCTRKRRDLQGLSFHERLKRCSGGGGGGIETITVVGQRISDPFVTVIRGDAIRGFLDSFAGQGVITHEGGFGGGPSNQQQQDKDCHGDVGKVDTKGASSKTAGQDANAKGLTGVAASNKLAQNDLNRLKQFKEKINQVSKETGMDAAIIAAIISRESRGGAALDSNHHGDNGNGFGLMQIDKRFHTTQGAWNSAEHIKQGVGILQGMINGVRDCHPSWSDEQVLKGGISAYNAGVRNVRNYDRMDVGTTGDDYANDVIARAQYLKQKGFDDPKDQKCQGGSRRRRGTCPYSWFNPNETRPVTSGSSGGASSRGGSGSTGGSSSRGSSSRHEPIFTPRCVRGRCTQIP
ncbi:uncharacterized protein LOC106179286 isoform X2 [Lingula anatina]|uniref:Lysozyme g n=1 Tax=Lingula anatina TaxID=7574 RepID=A0A1S3K769_LINAN|nr:uncharacterized protein LOC106179286 isoform X1 [Lingula anatina]XP_013418289.1 uncharacterized protein LOC106179286 isoform X2 [Lingula anatina]|eukprot:XP_013418288.1 uncharacterized protein LOC106179286 isoform X1 [Lingula anatina]